MNAISPDCRDGKHRACNSAAWDFDRDEPTPCTCPCHLEHTLDAQLTALAGATAALGWEIAHALRLPELVEWQARALGHLRAARKWDARERTR